MFHHNLIQSKAQTNQTPQHKAKKMTPSIQDPQNLTNREECELAVQVLQLLDGLSVGSVRGVLDVAQRLMNGRTRHDFNSDWLQQFVAELQALDAQ